MNVGKRILITGASGGIGGAIARTLAKPHHHFILQGRNESHLRSLCKQVEKNGATAEVWVSDFAKLEEETLLEKSQYLQNIDIYIHSSGQSLYKMLIDTTLEEWDQLFQVHVRSAFMITKQILPHMVSQRFGRIVFISSIWGEVGASCEVAYSAAKGAMQSFCKALAKEVAPSGVTVNAVAPGAVETRMILDHFSLDEVSSIEEQIPMGRLARPEEIASLVEYLVSEHSGYITGQVIHVNGGWK